MAKELLAIPEENLADVVKVIRHGIQVAETWLCPGEIDPEVLERLADWCDEEESYLETHSRD